MYLKKLYHKITTGEVKLTSKSYQKFKSIYFLKKIYNISIIETIFKYISINVIDYSVKTLWNKKDLLPLKIIYDNYKSLYILFHNDYENKKLLGILNLHTLELCISEYKNKSNKLNTEININKIKNFKFKNRDIIKRLNNNFIQQFVLDLPSVIISTYNPSIKDIYVPEISSIITYNENYEIISLIELITNGLWNDGKIEYAIFNYPQKIKRSKNNSIIICDTCNHMIRKIEENKVYTLYGSGNPGFLEGSHRFCDFKFPNSIELDNQENIFVADTNNHRIVKIDSMGNVFTICGDKTIGLEDGIGKKTKFKYPSDITIDNDNNLYVIEQLNNTIRKLSPYIIEII
jgi:hypothetical protein